MAFEILAFLIVASHVITVALLVLWLGLKKLMSVREFGRRFRREFLSFSPRGSE